MKNSRWIIPLIIFAAVIFSVSCGDDETPAGPGTYPTASILTATTGTSNSVSTSWTMCPDENFSEYSLYRSLTEGISANPPDSPVRVATNAADTTFTNTGLEWNTDYYYAVRTKNTDNLYSWSNEVPVTTPDSGSTGDYLTCYQIQGQQSSSPYEDQIVSVTGIVTAGGDELYYSYGPVAVLGDPDGGPWTGLVLFGDSVASLARGDSILITGTVQEFYGLTELGLISSVEVISTGNELPQATEVSTGDISGSPDPEEYESVLCTISDAIVTEVQGYGQLLADDGSGNCIVDDMGSYSYSPAVGDTIFTGTGILWYSWDEWKLEPRDDNDLITSGGGGGDVYTCYEIQGQQSSSPFDGQTVSVTGIVTADLGDYPNSSYSYAFLGDYQGGAWTGLMMYGDDLSVLNRGDSVTITGEIAEWYGCTEIKFPTNIVVHSSGHPLPPTNILPSGDLPNSSDSEQWESVLVGVENVEVTSEPDSYGTWGVDDGSGECLVDDWGDYSYTPSLNDTLASIAGVLSYDYGDFKIQPRDDNDIVQ